MNVPGGGAPPPGPDTSGGGTPPPGPRPPVAFELTLPTRLVFGRGRFEALLPDLAASGRRLLLVHGASAAPLAARIRAAAPGDTLSLTCRGEPEIDGLRAHLAEARAFAPDAVVAIGGGAAIDLGKALAALVPGASDPLRHLEVVGEGQPLDAPPLRLAAVPTTAGTGAEATRNAVIGVPAAGRKASLRDPRLVPALALVDPGLTESAPMAVKLASGLDAVTQVIEPFLSRGATPLTDALCRDAIPRGLAALRAVIEASSPAAHDDMALASLAGGIALSHAGLGAVHALAGVLGGRLPAAHGALCGRLLAPVLAEVLPRMGDGRAAFVEDALAAAFGRDPLPALAAWADAAGLPRLGDFGLDRAAFADVAEAALGASAMRHSPAALDAATLSDILAAAL